MGAQQASTSYYKRQDRHTNRFVAGEKGPRIKLRHYLRFRFGLVLGIGAVLASVLCFQCVRTYLYADSVLVPRQAEREAERQAGALTIAARRANITDPHALSPVIANILESASDHLLWVRILNTEGEVIVQGGTPQRTAKVPADWWDRVDKHENLGRVTETTAGKALVTMLPFRMLRPPQPPAASRQDAPTRQRDVTWQTQPGSTGRGPAPGRRPGLIVELAIPLKAVSGALDGLRRDLILGVIVSIALLLSIVVIVLRTPHYLRGKYLESELQLAKRVQKNLQPRPHSIPPEIEFAASAVAADHVGGDFYDIFEAGSGKIAIVLGDVSGKGVPAALLVSMLQGAIRSSTATDHESACEKINRMLCERTACERFATLFWGIFDPANGTLRYVNAGHAAPILVRHRENRMDRLDEGGPVLGVLPMARYAAGAVQINPSDTLILYSDGVNEALNEREEEFGEDRILETIHCAADQPPGELCEQIMHQVTAFSNSGPSPDDRTLMVVRFLECGSAQEQRGSALRVLEEVA